MDLLCYVASEALRSNGYTVICAESREFALRLLEDYPVDLLLTRFEPGGAGSYFIQAARKLRPAIKYLLITDPTEEQQKMESPQVILSKPFSAEALLIKVKTLLDQRAIRMAK